MNGYLDTLKEQSVSVILGGSEVVIPRSHLGLHLALSQVTDEFESAPGSVEMGAAIRGYFSLLGVDISQASPVEVLRAYIALRELNAQKWALPFQKNAGPAPESKEIYDYEGRGWVWLISKMASRFGWSREQIFDLCVEEAFCYVQEILIAEHGEREFQYSLSEKSHQYDKASGRSFYVPYQKPAWMLDYSLPKPVRVLKSHLPFGVKTLDGQEVIYH